MKKLKQEILNLISNLFFRKVGKDDPIKVIILIESQEGSILKFVGANSKWIEIIL